MAEKEQAIDLLKFYEGFFKNIGHEEEVKSIEAIINFIEKQAKEIDILKNHASYLECKICGKEFRSMRNDAMFCESCKKEGYKRWYNSRSEEQIEKRRKYSREKMREYRAKKLKNN